MPGTAHRVVDDEPFRERAAVVRAMSADGEHVRAATHEQDSLLSHMADQLAAVRQFGGRDSERQIGADRLSLFLSHSALPGQFFAAFAMPSLAPELHIKGTGVRRGAAFRARAVQA